MREFDDKFEVQVKDDFTLLFREPLIFSEDLLYLAKLQPTVKLPAGGGKIWRYTFRKVNGDNRLAAPEIKFHWDLMFNESNRLEAWSLSPLFTQIAPPALFEVFLRSLANAEVDTLNYRVKVDMDPSQNISADLPTRQQIFAQFGEPLKHYSKDKDNTRVNLYRFILDSPDVEEGYEERAVTTLKLAFDNNTNELVSMSGRYAGLKIAINYRDMMKEAAPAL
ncbi:MAG: hypothetical protein ACU833_03455 [Gammaproteobacteria bacterium]